MSDSSWDNVDCYDFGSYRLCLRTRELRRNDEPVQIEKKVWALLAYLIANRDRAVSKDELQDAVWDGRPLSESVLARTIMKARHAVGDCGEEQSIIKTVRGYGYRFVAEAVPRSADATPTVTSAGTSPAARWWPRAGSVAALVLLAVATLWLRGSPTSADTTIAVLPVDNHAETQELAWAELGLMRLIAEALPHDRRLHVVSPRRVLSEVEGMDSDARDRVGSLRRRHPDWHVLATELRVKEGVQWLKFTLYRPGGKRTTGQIVDARAVRLASSLGQRVGRALGISESTPDTWTIPEDPQARELLARAYSARLSGDHRRARDLLEQTLERAPKLAEARLALARVESQLGHYERSRVLLERVITEAEASDNHRAKLEARRAYGLMAARRGDLAQAEDHFRAALKLAENERRSTAGAWIRTRLGRVLGERGWHDEASDMLEGALQAHRRHDDGAGRAQALQMLAELALRQGNATLADRISDDALELAGGQSDQRTLARTLVTKAAASLASGDWGRASAYNERALDLAESLGARTIEARSRLRHSTLLLLKGRSQAARTQCERALELAQGMGRQALAAAVLAQIARIQIASGQFAGARRNLEGAHSLLQGRNDRTALAGVQLDLTALALRRGRFDAARRHLERLRTAARSLKHDYFKAQTLRFEAMLHRRTGKLDLAEQGYREAITIARGLGHGHLAATVSTELAQLCLQRDKLDQATALVAQLRGWIPRYYPAATLKSRLYYRRGHHDLAIEAQLDARAASGESWAEGDRRLLSFYRQTMSGGQTGPLPPWSNLALGHQLGLQMG